MSIPLPSPGSAAGDQLETEVLAHQPQAIIFDCDGTLTHSMPGHYEAWRQVLEPLGVEFLESRFYQLAGVPSDRIVAMLSQEQGIPLDFSTLADQKEQKFLDQLHLLEPIEPVVQLARKYHSQLPIGVASGGFRAVIEHQLQQLGIFHLFRVVVAAEDTERHKPEPDVFLEAARRLEIAAENCCVLEDSELGIEAARRAGMAWVDVRPYYPQ